MSVIVMGVDYPEDCDSCWLPGKHCDLWIVTDAGERHRGCPLRPLPEKHGRLIDAEIPEDDRQVYGFFYDTDLQELLDKQPTIVETEGE